MVRQPQRRPTTVCAFVRISEAAVLSEYGCKTLAQAGDICIADIPLDRMARLSKDQRVKRIEANWGAEPLLDSLAMHAGALPVYEGAQLPQAFTGKDVVVGVMDIGFDLTHPTFFSRDMQTYRIVRLWDMLSTDTTGSGTYVGRDYTTQEELLTLGCSRDGSLVSHGTHTAGIAAGSGYDTDYRGLAPESDICLVANAVSENAELIDTADVYKYTFATDALGFKYIFDYAEAVGKPCVISLSEGSAQDFLGYDQLYYEMLERMVGPGRILVVAAGNQGHLKTWLEKPRGMASAGTFVQGGSYTLFTYKSADAFSLRVVSYGEAGNDTLIIKTTDILAADDSTMTARIEQAEDAQLAVQVTGYPSCYDAAEMCYDLEIQSNKSVGNTIPVSVEMLGEDAHVEGFKCAGYFVENGKNPALQAGSHDYGILSPGSAPCVICVGNNAYRTGFRNYRQEWVNFDGARDGRVSQYSSVGPTFDGRLKPDVVAPGTNIISAWSSYYGQSHPDADYRNWYVGEFDCQGRTYAWRAESGTSMSSPAVAGIIALWLQAKPNLTREEIMAVIARTARHPDSELTYPNMAYGYGEIDAYAGLLDILGADKIKDVAREQSAAHFQVVDGRLRVTMTEPAIAMLRLRLYDLAGHCLTDTQLPAHETAYTIELPPLASGVYAIQLDGPAVGGSSLIRL